jgi:probable lipoprotein NlpC
MKRILILFLLGLFFSPTIFCEVGNVVYSQNPKLLRNQIISKAKSFLGTPYRYAGTSYNGVDCSGLVFSVYKSAAKKTLPRTVNGLYSAGKKISKNSLQPGDLVFFNTTGGISHVGISLGGKKFIHAASAGRKTGVITSSLDEKYYKTRYRGSRTLVLFKNNQKKIDLEGSEKPEARPKKNSNPESIYGKWKGDKGVHYVQINTRGKGFLVFANGTKMKIRYRFRNNHIIFSQAEQNRTGYYSNVLNQKLSKQLARMARPMSWEFTLSKDGKTLKGVKKTTSVKFSGNSIMSINNDYEREAIWVKF